VGARYATTEKACGSIILPHALSVVVYNAVMITTAVVLVAACCHGAGMASTGHRLPCTNHGALGTVRWCGNRGCS
jgi:hypothetical protein